MNIIKKRLIRVAYDENEQNKKQDMAEKCFDELRKNKNQLQLEVERLVFTRDEQDENYVIFYVENYFDVMKEIMSNLGYEYDYNSANEIMALIPQTEKEKLAEELFGVLCQTNNDMKNELQKYKDVKPVKSRLFGSGKDKSLQCTVDFLATKI